MNFIKAITICSIITFSITAMFNIIFNEWDHASFFLGLVILFNQFRMESKN